MSQRILKIFCDGGARGNPGPAASAFVVFEQEGEKIFSKKEKIGNTTNNVAEYFSVIIALEWLAEQTCNTDVSFFLDSELVVRQINGRYKIKNKRLLELFLKIQKLLQQLPGKITFVHIPREKNKIADALVNAALDEKN